MKGYENDLQQNLCFTLDFCIWFDWRSVIHSFYYIWHDNHPQTKLTLNRQFHLKLHLILRKQNQSGNSGKTGSVLLQGNKRRRLTNKWRILITSPQPVIITLLHLLYKLSCQYWGFFVIGYCQYFCCYCHRLPQEIVINLCT